MWKSKFAFKDLLVDSDVVPEKAREIADTILGRLQGDSPFSLSARSELATWFNDAEDQDSLNIALDKLYDFADAERIWLGFRP